MQEGRQCQVRSQISDRTHSHAWAMVGASQPSTVIMPLSVQGKVEHSREVAVLGARVRLSSSGRTLEKWVRAEGQTLRSPHSVVRPAICGEPERKRATISD
jgi:hypothetical protein